MGLGGPTNKEAFKILGILALGALIVLITVAYITASIVFLLLQ